MTLGPHIILPTKAALDWAKRAPIVKSLDRVDTLRAAQPGAITIYRKYFTPYEQDALDADHVYNAIMADLAEFKPSYVELLNETHQRIIWGLADYCRFTWECVQRFHAVGIQVAGFSNSTGQPEQEDVLFMAQYDPPFAGVDAWAKHEYWGNEGLSTWHTLRYRRDHDILSGQHPPIIITECGRDRVEGGLGGWRRDGVSGEQYVAELLAYNAELERDSYVIGATPFTSGPTADWAAFDLDAESWRIPGGGTPTIEGGDMDEETRSKINQLLAQNALLTNAAIAILRGNLWDGAESVAGQVIALTGKSLDELGLTPPKA